MGIGSDLAVEAESLAELAGEPFGELAEESGVADWSAGFWQPEAASNSVSAVRVIRECGRDKGHLREVGNWAWNTILFEKGSFWEQNGERIDQRTKVLWRRMVLLQTSHKKV